jgi:transcription initiation factor IIF auxiliary subunit
VRGVQNEDMSYFISKVVFHLHHSFANPTREIVEPPYEVQVHIVSSIQCLVSSV